MAKKRTYLEPYADFGFDSTITGGVQKPKHIFCSQVLGNDSMKPSIVKARFISCHSARITTPTSLYMPSVLDFVLAKYYLVLDSRWKANQL